MARATPHLLGGLTGAAAAVLTACLLRPSVSAPSALGREGVYTFTERIARTSESIAGKVTILADTVMVDLALRPCRYDSDGSGDAIVYNCTGVGLWFDRRDPVGKSFYRARRTVTVPHAVCTRLDVRPNGDRVCLVYEDQPFVETADLTGPLRLVAVSVADSIVKRDQ